MKQNGPEYISSPPTLVCELEHIRLNIFMLPPKLRAMHAINMPWYRQSLNWWNPFSSISVRSEIVVQSIRDIRCDKSVEAMAKGLPHLM